MGVPHTFPAYFHTLHPWVITDSLGQPVKTKGAVVVKQGSRTVGTVKLPSATRRPPFSGPRPGAQKPGSHTAALTLTDTTGRTTTATQQVIVAKSSTGLCT